MKPAISISEVSYTYPKTTKPVLKALSIDILQGESFGLLGPNGAGKTTLLSCVCRQITDFEGQIAFFSKNIQDLGQDILKLGFAPQELALFSSLSAEANLDFFSSLSGLRGSELDSRVEWALRFTGLLEQRGQKVETLSGGMKRRLNLAVALLNKPEILILDEPTVGVDPQTRNHIFEKVEELKTQGLTIVYTTHYMEEVERLCEKVAIIDKGELLFHGTLEALKKQQGHERLEQCYLSLTSGENQQ